MELDEVSKAFKHIIDALNQIRGVIEDSVKAFSDMLDSLREVDIKYRNNHKQPGYKKNRCFKESCKKLYKVEIQVRKNLPYQRRCY